MAKCDADTVMQAHGWDPWDYASVDFFHAWMDLADDARADAWGSAECRRVWGMWRRYSRSGGVAAFIRRALGL